MTREAVSKGEFCASQVDNPTDKSEILGTGMFLKPDIEQVMENPLDAMLSAPENLMTNVLGSRGPVADEFSAAAPNVGPF